MQHIRHTGVTPISSIPAVHSCYVNNRVHSLSDSCHLQTHMLSGSGILDRATHSLSTLSLHSSGCDWHPQTNITVFDYLQVMPLVQWQLAHQNWTTSIHFHLPLFLFLWNSFFFFFFCSMGWQSAQLAITHGLQYVELKLMRVLVVYLAVSMVIQMAEGSTWLSNCEPTWCLSAPLTVRSFFFFQYTLWCTVASQSKMPFQLWIVFSSWDEIHISTGNGWVAVPYPWSTAMLPCNRIYYFEIHWLVAWYENMPNHSY